MILVLFLLKNGGIKVLKITTKNKKILAMLIVIITLFTIVQPPVFGANHTISGSGNGKFMARQYATKLKTTDNVAHGENGIIARRLIMTDKNWSFGNKDGILVFCAQMGVHFDTRNKL